MKKFTLINKHYSILAFLLFFASIFAQGQITPSDMVHPENYVITGSTSPDIVLPTGPLESVMELPTQNGTFLGWTRGYFFTAPCDLTITGLRVPEDASTASQNIEIIKFNSGPPPSYSSSTNDFVSLGRWINVAGSNRIDCTISIVAGDVIGILGDRGDINSYGTGPYTTSINGNSVVLTRIGMQYPLSTTIAQDIWQESGGSIGRIEMYYTAGSAVPVSFWVIVASFLIVGIFIVIRFVRL